MVTMGQNQLPPLRESALGSWPLAAAVARPFAGRQYLHCAACNADMAYAIAAMAAVFTPAALATRPGAHQQNEQNGSNEAQHDDHAPASRIRRNLATAHADTVIDIYQVAWRARMLSWLH